MLSFALPPADPLRVLCLGAHADDIEIGCGATLLELLDRRRVDVHWIVFSGSGDRRREAESAAARFLESAAEADIIVHDFADGRFPMVRGDLKDEFERLKRATDPDLLFTHDEGDLHQDHALLGRLTRETFRDHVLLGYEVPKFDGGLRRPNVFVPVDRSTAERKTRLIVDTFESQRPKQWMDQETLLGLMRLRGVECASETRYAEGFHVPKVRLEL